MRYGSDENVDWCQVLHAFKRSESKNHVLIGPLQVISQTAQGRRTWRRRAAGCRRPRRLGRRPFTFPSTRRRSGWRRSDSIRQRPPPARHCSNRRRTRHNLLHSTLLSGLVGGYVSVRTVVCTWRLFLAFVTPHILLLLPHYVRLGVRDWKLRGGTEFACESVRLGQGRIYLSGGPVRGCLLSLPFIL